jgi:acid phosphatase type 7
MAVRRLVGLVALTGVSLTLLFVCVGRTPEQPPAPADTGVQRHVLVGAGDIAACGIQGAELTASLLDRISGTVFTLGDNAYGSGTLKQFEACYGPTWGRHRDRTRPAPGNHDYRTEGASGYFGYFGYAAGDPDKGYYSYRLGDWLILVLNSNCRHVEGGCGEDSPQVVWLREELEGNTTQCTLAYFHHPVFSSGPHGGSNRVRTFWSVLSDAGADVVVTAHDHLYERFAPLDADGNLDADRGITHFVVGTGGGRLYEFEVIQPHSEARYSGWGVLTFELFDDSYAWEFIATEPGFSDEGTARCT